MAFEQEIEGVTEGPYPPIADLALLRPARRSPVVLGMRAQDRVLPMGRRVVAAQSVLCCPTWRVPDTNPVQVGGSRTHPNPLLARVAMRARADITPGHMLRITLAATPAGETQNQDGADWVSGGAGGQVEIEVVWHPQTGSDVTVTYSIPSPASSLQYAAAPVPGWANVQRLAIDIAVPEELDDAATLETWTSHVGVDVAVAHHGGLRVLDLVVAEVPHRIARDGSGRTDMWVSHIFGSPDVETGGPPTLYPLQRIDDGGGDPRGGTWHLADVAAAQGLRLGPALFQWSAYTETTGNLAGTELVSFDTSSTTFVRVPDAVVTTWNATAPGFSLACGGYARDQSEDHEFWSDTDGSIPVVVATYGRAGAASTALVRVQSAAHSWVDVAVTAGASVGWTVAYGHLRCGLGPGDNSVAQIFLRRTSGAATVNLSAVHVHRVGRYATTF